MYQVGLSTNGKVLGEELFIKYEEAGIEAMELALGEDEYLSFDYEKAKLWAEAHGVKLWSLHLPFRPTESVNLASFDEEVRNDTIKYYSEITTCFYNEEHTEEELVALADKASELYDYDLVNNKTVEEYYRDLIVISYNEITPDVELQSVGMITA